MKPTTKKHDLDDDDDQQPGAWVLATYHCYHSLSINFVVRVKGKPQADWHPTSARHEAYRWNSYHAARKFQSTHSQLRGYIIMNLSVIEKQAEEQRQVHEEWINNREK